MAMRIDSSPKNDRRQNTEKDKFLQNLAGQAQTSVPANNNNKTKDNVTPAPQEQSNKIKKPTDKKTDGNEKVRPANNTSSTPGLLPVDDSSPWQKQFMENYAANVAIDTSDSKNTLKLSQTIAERLKGAGIPAADIEVIDTSKNNDGKGILYAVLKSPNRLPNGQSKLPPIVFLAHSDTVPAKADEWKIKNVKGETIQLDPFKLTAVSGPTFDADGKPLAGGVQRKLFGRGINDNKNSLSAIETMFERLAREGYRGDRDYILLFTPDEENGDETDQGMNYIFKNRPELLKGVELIINEGGYGRQVNGKVLNLEGEVAEKVYTNYRLEAKGLSGHSSEPAAANTNALYKLGQALVNVGKLEFPIELNDVTRAYFEKVAPSETPEKKKAIEALLNGSRDPKVLAPLLSDSFYNAQLRTTCVATNLEKGLKDNTIPGSAAVTVNCRVMPGTPTETVTKTLTDAVNNPSDLGVTVSLKGDPLGSGPSPVDPVFFKAADEVVKTYYGKDVAFVPSMVSGASTMLYFRNLGYLSYGINFFPLGERLSNMHGNAEWIDENAARIAPEAYYALSTKLANTPLAGTKQPPSTNK